ncbi:CHRD domain-containing protein [Hazenella sp. IB182357]|uniref:CHRD domain-containing protein n=1 Tax=Polycladospora coralii TaxID=2771432 RepID=A0A926RTL2_9BACL|nr:CHRD domain-containing protein [Polycladospora coralii]MBD1371833.1 CHRD domain-containing protein [Polycladospora coralii]MBS7529294.1 CHRD domain-containing protein [Polycladospora coralii]
MASARFCAHLTGGAQVPAVSTKATGFFEMRQVNKNKMVFFLRARNLRRFTQAHIHLGGPNTNGPVVVWLFPAVKAVDPVSRPGVTEDRITFSGTVISSHLRNNLAGDSIQNLVNRIRSGKAYVNAHTVQYPGGEIRGQLRPC